MSGHGSMRQLAASLLASAQGRSVRSAARLRVRVLEDAVQLTVLAVAGRAELLHGFAVSTPGAVGTDVRCYTVAEPRNAAQQAELLRSLAAELLPVASAAVAQHAPLQIIVSCRRAVYTLGCVADALRNRLWVEQHGAGREGRAVARVMDAQLVELADVLTFLTHGRHEPGQQGLFAATELLELHYATPAEVCVEEDLGVLLATMNPPAHRALLDVVEEAEQRTSGCHTDPAFDRDTLEPLVEAFDAAQARAPEEATRLSMQIRACLTPLLLDIHGQISEAIGHLACPTWSELPGVEMLVSEQAYWTGRALSSRAKGYPGPRPVDSSREGSQRLVRREHMQEQMERELAYHDVISAEEAVRSGVHVRAVLCGMTSAPRPGARRAQDHTLELRTTARGMTLRPGDVRTLREDHRFSMRVVSMTRDAAGTVLRCVLTRGARSRGDLVVGASYTLAGPPPDWTAQGRHLKTIAQNFQQPHWSHSGRASVPASTRRSVAPPADLLRTVEGLT